MTTTAELHEAARYFATTSGDFNGDVSAMMDALGVPPGQFAERLNVVMQAINASPLTEFMEQDPYGICAAYVLSKFPEGDAHLYIPGAQIPVLGPELVVNGDFSNGLTGWNKYGADATANAGEVALTATATSYPQIGSAPITIIPGRVYQVQGTCRSGVNSQPLTVRPSPTQGANYTTTTSAVDTVKSCTFLATVSTINVLAMMETASATVGSTAYFKNISVREVLSYTDRISNFSAGNFFDTAGSNLALSKVDQTVGRVNDAARGLGPELVTNGDFSVDAGWVKWQPTAGAVTIAGGGCTINNTDGSLAAVEQGMCVAGKTYAYRVVIASSVGAGVQLTLGSKVLSFTTVGVFTGFVVASSATSFVIKRNGTGQITNTVIDSISIREVIGTHATQPTSNYMPYLRRGAIASNPNTGLYSWEFDGADDYLKLDKPLFQMSDDHCVIAGAKCSNLTNSMAIFDQRSSSSTNPVVCKLAILPTTGALTAQWSDDSGATLISPNAGSCSIGENIVFTARKIGNTKGCRKNGGVFYADSTVLGTTTITSATIGATSHTGVTMHFSGNIYPVIAIKGTVSDADLLTLEKWVGKMSGVTI